MQRLPAPELPDWLARMVPFTRYLTEVDGHRIHVMESGAGRPVVLLHGNPTWSFLYRKVVAALAGAPLRLIMPDLVGLGLSDKPREASFHTLERHGRIFGLLLDQLLGELAPAETLVFVGQDWGGPVGLRALAERRERVSGLVLMNTVASPPRPGFRPSVFHRFARMPVLPDIAFRLLGFPQNNLAGVQGDRSSISGDVARAYRYPLRHLRDRAAPLALARMVPDSDAHPSVPALLRCQEFVQGFKGPSALVWGERDPILGRVGSWMQKLLPHASLTRTQAGHFLQEEVPEEIAAAIRSVCGLA